MKPYAENRKAHFEYETLEQYEGGLELTGQEVKSIRAGGAKLAGAYLKILRSQLWLIGAHITRYAKAAKTFEYDPERSRRVLVSKKELLFLIGKTQEKGLTLVPFSFYPKARRIKVGFALCRGKKTRDKRQELRERDQKRATARFLRGRDE